jgi:hypothetical protein
MQKEEGFDKWQEDNMFKEFSEDISWVNGPTDMKEPYHIRTSNDLMDTTILSQRIVAFVERGMRDDATGYHTLVITKHVDLAIKTNCHHFKSMSKVCGLFSSNASSNKFRTIHQV